MSKTEKGIEVLSARLRGEVIGSTDKGYDEARSVWNGMIDRRPAMIARCNGAADVVSTLGFAREHGLPFSVRSGGHGVAGQSVCDDGLVIDLSGMKLVRVDPEARIARVGAGATLGDLDHETQAFGLATPVGMVSRTGVAGLTLGGGLGWLSRRFGLALDNLRSVDVVTADGRLLQAGPDEHADLFWALRGGGGRLGIVTSMEFQLHSVGPQVTVAQVFHPLEDLREVLDFYRDFVSGVPDELTCYAMLMKIPPMEPFPESLHGRPVVGLAACHSGPAREAEAALSQIKEFGNPLLDVVQPMPYAALQQGFDAAAPDGAHYYWKSHYLSDLDEGTVSTLAEAVDRLPGTYTVAAIEQMGGAIGRVSPDATAFAHREAGFSFGVWAGWEPSEDTDEIVEWVRGVHGALTPHATGGMYLNYLDREDQDKLTSAFGENLDRLKRVKQTYDPDAVFPL